MKQTVLTITALLAVAFAGFVIYGNSVALGSAPSGLEARVATSSFQGVVAATAEFIIATSTNCAARVISTQAGEIKLTFSDHNGQRPTQHNGITQAASTTVVYDGGLYGCGAVWVYPYSTATLTLVETR